MIRTRALTKRFGATVAVDGVDLHVRQGDRYGFLGPNGSGKTTLVRMLLGLVYPTSGEVEIMSRPIPGRAAEVLPEVGSLIEGPAAYGHLSGRRNLSLIDASGAASGASVSGAAGRPGVLRRGRDRRRRIEEALDHVGLGGIDARPVKAYSLGMRQRLGLAAALLRSPRLLILDEPTNGLDPQGILEIRELLTTLNEAGTTVFVCSHLLAEVERLCTRVGVIDRGRLVLEEKLAGVRAATGRIAVESPDAAHAAALLDGRVEQRQGDRLLVRHPDPAELNALLVAGGVRVTEITVERRSLEQLVLEVTSHGADRIAGDRVAADRVAADEAGADRAGAP